jgi:hypothetical protein
MAVQNFLSGGFYGRLGNVVGQRWHNKRTLRRYVIGNDPKTPAQLAHREIFARATRLAQDAMNINRGHESWDTSEKGEFPQRVGTACRRLQNGMSDGDALPLYPDGYVSDITIEGGVIDWSDWSEKAKLITRSPAMTESRQFVLMLHCKSILTDDWNDFSFTVTVPAGSTLSYEWLVQDGYCFPRNSYVTGATSDDATHGNTSIRLQPVYLNQPTIPIFNVDLSFSAPVLDISPNWEIPVTLSKGIEWYDELDVEIWCRSLDTAQMETQYKAIEINQDGESKIPLENGVDWTYPPGSCVEGGSFTSTKTDFEVEFSWISFYFTIP